MGGERRALPKLKTQVLKPRVGLQATQMVVPIMVPITAFFKKVDPREAERQGGLLLGSSMQIPEGVEFIWQKAKSLKSRQKTPPMCFVACVMCSAPVET